jgi:hypothetical protein
MMQKRTIARWTSLALLVTAAALPAAAQDSAIAQITTGAATVEWLPVTAGYDRLVLTVTGPQGLVLQREFAAGATPAISLFDAKGQRLADGRYAYELRIVPNLAPGVRERLAAARAAGDDAAIERIQRRLPKAAVQSGAFAIADGALVTTGGTETRPGTGGGVQSAAKPGLSNITLADQVIPDDLIVQGSGCFGFDCVNNESFGFDTIRLKENNLRIKFEDTSTGTFPANDWQLTANDSASGGSNKFSIEDITGSRVPFTVTAGAATNSLFIDSTGRVGFRTSTPVLDLHVNTSNTPALRLEQNSSGGFTAQTWDIGANEANFFVRDVTGGSRLSFRIRPGAPTSSIDISSDGDVGIGTASPSEKLHILESGDANTITLTQNTNGTGTAAAGVVRAQADIANTSFIAHGTGRTLSRFGQVLGGWNELIATAGNGQIVGTVNNTPLILGTNNTARMTIAAGGAITVPGNFTVTGVKNFAMPDPADARRAIYYVSLEGPEAGTYIRGTAKTVGGEAVIELPGHFSRITETERMTVQLTPIGSWGQIFVAEKTPGRLVVRTAPGAGDQEFDYMVQGIRKGYLDYQVERVNDLPQ